MKDKVVIITGASSGIGKACAIEFAKKGANVVLSGRDIQKLEAAETELKKITNNVLIVEGDVGSEDDCKRLINCTISRFNKIDVLICNAGLSMRALFAETDLSVIKKLMDTNFWGTVYCTKYALPFLLAVGGSLVGISSIAGKKGLPGRSGYSASKFAMEGFLETIRAENSKNKLHVLLVCPGFTSSNIRNTALSKDGNMQGESPRNETKMMSAEKVAEHILKAVQFRKRDLVLSTDGKFMLFLNKFFPAWMDKLVYSHMAKEPGSPFK